MRNVHKIDTRLISIPREAQTDDCGLSHCKIPQLVLSHATDTTNWKNDKTSFAFKFDSMTVKLVKEGVESLAVGYDFTFPKQPDAVGFVIDWRQNPYGCFRVKIEWELAGVSGWFWYSEYQHLPYTCENARNTVRLFVHLDDFVRKQGINYKGSGFYGTIRFRGIFGFMQPNYDTENIIYSDRVRHKVRIEAIRSYELRSDALLHSMTRLIDEDVLLTANNILITDHNTNNHNQEYKDFPVILSDTESPKFEYSDIYSSVTAIFNEKVAQSESRYSSDINAPLPIVQTVVNGNPIDVTINGITVVNDAITDVNLTLKDQEGNEVEFTQVGNALTVDTETWIRPFDWLPMPNIDTSEQVFYGICMVHQDQANLVSLRFTGDYTVDWGDGVVENFASNVVAHHQYSWSSVGNVTSEGFRQALIKVTPQAGQDLTGINLQFKHPLMGGGNLKNSIFIDMVMNLPQLAGGTSIVLGGAVSIRHSFVERLNIMSIGSATSLASLCYGFFKLQKFEIGDTSNIQNMQNMFTGCRILQSVPLFNTVNVQNMQSMFFDCFSLTTVPLYNTASVTNMQSMFYDCFALQTVPLFNTVIVTNMLSMFQNCYSLTTVPLFNTTNVQNMTSMFQFCYTLQTVTLINTANVTNMTSMFQNCQFLKSVTLNLSSVSTFSNPFASNTNIDTLILNGCRYGFSIANNEMSASALNNMFTSLGTAVGSQTITITGNPGAPTCNTAIATGKGFTVVI